MGNSLIKLVRRKRRNSMSTYYYHYDYSDAEQNQNPAQENGGHSNEMTAKGISNESHNSSSSPIFKLNGHCFDELFEYLSLKELHSLEQTCKSMQQMTGEFFTRNYSAAKFNCLRDGIYLINRTDECISVPGFIELITWIAIENNVIVGKRVKNRFYVSDIYPCDLNKFKYIALHADELKSVKKLTLTNVRINKQTMAYIRNILPNIEVLEIKSCTVYLFHHVLLKYCKNVRRIQLTQVTFRKKYKWLRRQYGKLVHLELGVQDESGRIIELCTFFELNPNVLNFSCDSSTLWSNKDALLSSKIKLDIFELKHIGYKIVFEEKPLWDLLRRLHANSFYKRLHINSITNEYCEQLPAMPYLEQLSIATSENSLYHVSNHLIEYAETADESLHSWNEEFRNNKLTSGKSKNEIIVEELMNVERLYLFRDGLDIQLFIQQLRNLKKLKLTRCEPAEILELDVLNRVREKLAGARKITIYVPNDVYLATKWATKNGTTNFSLIQMKRHHSHEWDRFLYNRRNIVKYYLPRGIF